MYEEFEEWLNSVLATGLPQYVKGVGFNMYEESEMNWSIQFIDNGSN